MISVIIPTLNEEKTLEATINSARVEDVEIIVSDGGSEDATLSIAERMADLTISSDCGRGRQMNKGAASASGEIILFLHADTLLPKGWPEEVYKVLSYDKVSCGAFRFTLLEKGAGLGLLSTMVNLRSKCLSLPYGDQALFMRRETFEKAGAFKEIPIMEDVDLVRRLGRKGRVELANLPIITSSRRWRNIGWLKTGLINQTLLIMYLLGVSPEKLVKLYKTFR